METFILTRRFEDFYYRSADKLKLYARVYPGDRQKPTLLCLHGLTRNSADFDPLANKLANYSIVSADQRGRGNSAWDRDAAHYRPDIYCKDMFTLIEQLNLSNIVAIGTSMGGLMTMMMGAMQPGMFKAAIINDIGPVVDPAGIKRISGYVGVSSDFKNWDEAVAAIKAQGEDIFEGFTDADWIAFAQRTCKKLPNGRIAFLYDPAIKQGLKGAGASAVPPDLWPVYDALKGMPLLVIRGAKSDILSPKTADEMIARNPAAKLATIPRRGHAPILDEPAAVSAITEFLEGLE